MSDRHPQQHGTAHHRFRRNLFESVSAEPTPPPGLRLKNRLRHSLCVYNRNLRPDAVGPQALLANPKCADRLSFRCAHTGIVQLADVLMRAIGYQWNDCHLAPDAKRAKIVLADRIAGKASLVTYLLAPAHFAAPRPKALRPPQDDDPPPVRRHARRARRSSDAQRGA